MNGMRIRLARVAKSLSQEEVAAAAGIGQSTLSRIEHSDLQDVTVGTLLALARVLDLPVTELLPLPPSGEPDPAAALA